MPTAIRTTDGQQFVVDEDYEQVREEYGALARGQYTTWEVKLRTGELVTLKVPNITSVRSI